ncbi:MAG: ABC transporter permease subunit [Candidatus Heimdallarchaeaceae archaeon]
MDKSIAISLKIVGFLLIFTAAFVPLYSISFESNTAEPDPIILVSSKIIASETTNLYYSNNYLFITDVNTGVQVFNVTDLTNPNSVGVYPVAGGANAIYIHDGFAYVVDSTIGLQILNISDVTNPSLVGTYALANGATKVCVQGNYSYLVVPSFGFVIVDVSDPTSPSFVGNYSLSSQINNIVVKGEYAFVVDSGVGLEIFDISVPSNPNLIGTYDVFGSANDIFVLNNVAYLVGDNIGLEILNTTDLTSPELLGSYDLEGQPVDVYVKNGFAYVADSGVGLEIIEVAIADEPTFSASYEIDKALYTFFVDGSDVYLLHSSGLEIFRVRPQYNESSSGKIADVLAFRVDYNLLTFNRNLNATRATYQESEVPSGIIVLSAALWFVLVFAILATVLGQVFQGGGLKGRGIVSDISAALLYLAGLIIAIIAMNRTLSIAASRYQAELLGQVAITPLDSPVTFNPNDPNPAYFLIKLTGSIGPGFYMYVIGVLLIVTGIFLPVDWQQPVGSKLARRMGETGVMKWIKNVANMRLTTYIMRRLLTLIPLFIAICVMTFVMVSGMGDPVSLLLLGKQRATEQDRINLTRKLGLDQPVYVQFIMWFYNFLQGDFGNSFTSGQSINSMIGGLIWETLKLQLAAYFFALLISIPLGIIAAKNQNTWIDSLASALALLGQSMPIFVFGLVLIYIFSGYGLGWFPAAKAHKVPTPPKVFGSQTWHLFWSGQWGSWWSNVTLRLGDSILHMVLPTVTLLFNFMALYTRLVRSTMLEVLRQDYILAARANGIAERKITWKHAFRNTLIPVVTYVGLFLATALAGAPITETLFTWPGLGYKYVQAIGFLDFPMILGTTAVLTILILIGNLVTDIVYVAVDPRIEL